MLPHDIWTSLCTLIHYNEVQKESSKIQGENNRIKNKEKLSKSLLIIIEKYFDECTKSCPPRSRG